MPYPDLNFDIDDRNRIENIGSVGEISKIKNGNQFLLRPRYQPSDSDRQVLTQRTIRGESIELACLRGVAKLAYHVRLHNLYYPKNCHFSF